MHEFLQSLCPRTTFLNEIISKINCCPSVPTDVSKKGMHIDLLLSDKADITNSIAPNPDVDNNSRHTLMSADLNSQRFLFIRK